MSNLLGSRIGHYRVIDLIGKGGMGEVYVGYDETLERKVALKCISADRRLDAIAKVRFLREARVLSHLAHPNICQIFDYIDGKDADVIVLELIRGHNLRTAMKKGISDREKLRVAEQIARVLMAAHEKNIVHRDLKPDNVMITYEGEVKVLDFGLSRTVVDEETLVLDASTLRTFRAQNPDLADMVPYSTPQSSNKSEVVSAEAASAQIIDFATVAGSDNPVSPLSGIEADDPTYTTEEPWRTPEVLTSHGAIMGTLGYMSPEQANGEQATPASDMYALGLLLQELFTGRPPYEIGLSPQELLRRSQKCETLPVIGIDPDLASIIGRLKARAPATRPSAFDTVERIGWIRNKPLRRQKRAFIAASIIALILFGIVMTLQTIRATRAEVVAKREADVAKNVSAFLVDLFSVSNPYGGRGVSGETVTARQMLDYGARNVTENLKHQPELQARMMATIGSVYRQLGLYDEARPLLTTALTLREQAYGPSDIEVADSMLGLASLYSDEGKYTDAEHLFRGGINIRERILGSDDPAVAAALHDFAVLQHRRGKFGEAEALYKRTIAILEKTTTPHDSALADALNELGSLYATEGKNREAEPLFERGLAIREKLYGLDHPRTANSLNNLAGVYFESGRIGDAEKATEGVLRIYEKAFGPQHPHVADILNNLGEIRQAQGRYSDAATLYQRSLDICEKAYGPEHKEVAYELNYLGKAYLDQDKVSDAEPLLRRSISIYENTVGLEHPDAAHALFNYGCLQARRGRTLDALAYLHKAFPAGYGSPWSTSIAEETTLASLHGDPEFEKLVAEAKKNAGT